MIYGQADLEEAEVIWFHVDRTVCDDDGCMCALPTSVQVAARKRASRQPKNCYVRYGFDDTGFEMPGPMTGSEADDLVSRLITSPGIKVKLLRVVEDYG